jgi:hypothetical protein
VRNSRLLTQRLAIYEALLSSVSTPEDRARILAAIQSLRDRPGPRPSTKPPALPEPVRTRSRPRERRFASWVQEWARKEESCPN